MRFSIKPKYLLVAIVVLAIALHWNVWNLDIMGIHAWRQTQTMTVVENFAFEDANIVNPRINSRGDGDGIFRMEFPIMQWVFAWFYKAFGSELIIARILSFIIYLASVLGFYRLIRAYDQSKSLSALAAWGFAWSPVLFYYSVNPLPDNLALSSAIWSMVFLKQHQENKSIASLVGFALFLSLATAVKLPYVVFGAGYIPILFDQLKRDPFNRSILNSLLILIIMLPALAWYGWVIPQWTNKALIGGVGAESELNYSVAIQNIWGVIHSILPELLINYGSVLFFIVGVVILVNKRENLLKHAVEFTILIFVSLYYLYEVNMIGLAHDYYLFPFLPSIFLLVSFGLKQVVDSQVRFVRILVFFSLIILPLTAYLRTDGRWEPMGSEKPFLAHKKELQELTNKDALVILGNDPSTHMFLYHIKRKGWTFEQDWFYEEDLLEYMNCGAKYLYCNSTNVDKNPEIAKHLGAPIFNKDGIRVYPLKPFSDS